MQTKDEKQGIKQNMMKNVYDELIDKRLIHILSDSCVEFKVPDTVYKNTAIAVNLYYEDTLHQYFEYLDKVPQNIEIYIYSSNTEAWQAISQYTEERDNMFFVRKRNRGRDISAFLVAFRNIALKKKYLCFLHDKKEKSPYFKEDTDYWIENLWSNTVNTDIYIKNVLGLLQKDQIGFLSPPIPFGEQFTYWYANRWGKEDLAWARELVSRLGLKCNIDPDKMPITLGSAFWCRTDAIRKILTYDWKYEDFEEEPLPSDGTISHAIERIFAYVAQDAGYTTEWILCPEYAGSLILKSQCQMTETYSLLKEYFITESLSELRKFDSQGEMVRKFCSGCKKIYLYGAGTEGRKFANWMRFWNLRVDGFVVTKLLPKQEKVSGLPVYEFGEIRTDKSVGIIIAVGSDLCEEIEKTVKKREGIKYCKLTGEMSEG